MTTTDLLKILSDYEYGAISRKPRNISLTINGKYMPNPRITLSSTGDGIVGPEIDLDIDGEFFEEQQPCEDAISRQAVLDGIDVKAWEFCDYLISKGRNDEQKPVSHFTDNLREYIRDELPSVNPQPKTGHLDQEQEPKQPENGSELFENPEKMDDRTTDGCISRERAMLRIREFIGNPTYTEKMLVDDMKALPPVQPKQVECEDAISRKWLVEALEAKGFSLTDTNYNIMIHLIRDTAPSVQPKPKTGHCKDCKWWKDSDGLYRRGGHAESQCPINRREVFEGNGYCYMYEPQESEETDADSN